MRIHLFTAKTAWVTTQTALFRFFTQNQMAARSRQVADVVIAVGGPVHPAGIKTRLGDT